jgi:hypothetical protein
MALVYDCPIGQLSWKDAMVQQPRPIRLSAQARQAIKRQLAAFREKFGRDPNDDDPILFDPDSDDPVPLSDEKYERMMIEAMTEVGISQAYRQDCDREEQTSADCRRAAGVEQRR